MPQKKGTVFIRTRDLVAGGTTLFTSQLAITGSPGEVY